MDTCMKVGCHNCFLENSTKCPFYKLPTTECICTKCLYRGKDILCPLDNLDPITLRYIYKMGHCGDPRLQREIPESLLYAVKEFLGVDGYTFFKDLKNKYGRIDVVIEIDGMPHPVHFREGMQIRNFIRDTHIIDDWGCRDLDDMWMLIVELALEI